MANWLEIIVDLPDYLGRFRKNYFEPWKKRTGLSSVKPLVTQERNSLAKLMMEFYKEHEDFQLLPLQEAGVSIPLIAKEGWIPSKPIDISEVGLEWASASSESFNRWDGLVERLREECGLRIWNGRTYRLVDVETDQDQISLHFTLGWYVDYVETCEALTWELGESLKHLIRRLTGTGSGKELLKDSKVIKESQLRRRERIQLFDLKNRSAAVGINTLTIIGTGNREEDIFLIHKRAEETVEAIGAEHVVPAGTFQPLNQNDAFHKVEFSLRRNVMREFGEELLNNENKKEELNRDLGAIDPDAPFSEDPELQRLKELFDMPAIRLFFLGIALDCVTTKPEILTVLLVNRENLKSIRGKPISNWEGHHESVSFSKEQLREWMSHDVMLPAGAGCLALAHRHFDEITEELTGV